MSGLDTTQHRPLDNKPKTIDQILSLKELAKRQYPGESESFYTSRMSLYRRQIADGVIRHAEREGTKWYINCTKEWPKLFPPVNVDGSPSLDGCASSCPVASAMEKLMGMSFGDLLRAVNGLDGASADGPGDFLKEFDYA